MDDIVKAALKKWPNVPHCYGWLALDARGDWYCRNYEHDERGAWFFQNGPQRVYVQLEAAPLVFGVRRVVGADGGVQFEVDAHTGKPVGEIRSVWLDEHGRLFLGTDAGLGVVRSMDMDAAADAVEAGVWAPQEIAFGALTRQFGHVLTPQP
jgi:Protein of unknown function (DUF2946)